LLKIKDHIMLGFGYDTDLTGGAESYSMTLHMFYPTLFNSNNFVGSVVMAELCALLGAILAVD